MRTPTAYPTAVMCTALLLNMVGFSNYGAVLPGIIHDLALTPSEAGFAGGIFFLSYAIGSPIASVLTDVIDPKRLYLAGCAAGLAGGLCFPLINDSYASLLIARLLSGLGMAGTYIPGMTLIGAAVSQADGDPDVVIFNASARSRGPLVELDPNAVENAIRVSAYAGFLVAQAAVKRMLPHGHGVVVFTGASASVKGYPQSAPFAMGKFALRGLAQSMARELHPQGIHVGHVVIDGAIRSDTRIEPADRPDSMLDADAIAQSYWQLIRQPRNAWSWEIEVRPWVEKF